MLPINTPAPEFSLPDQDGKIRNLSDYKGKKIILYFYPKDNTSGCTKQACNFAELFPHFREKGVKLRLRRNFQTRDLFQAHPQQWLNAKSKNFLIRK